ncbi:tyrosine-type recombinase/integrase [Gemmatimonadota bacterium]
MRLHDFLPIYVERYLKVKDPKSWKPELGRIRRIRDYFGNLPMDHIDAPAIEEFLADLSRQGFKPATVNRYHARLSSMMRRAMIWGYRKDNPVERIDSFKEPRMGDRYLSPEEFQQLLAACDQELRPMVLVAAQTGVRQGELLALRWEDINWNDGYLIVRAENSKTSESRIVPMNGVVVDALQSLQPRESGRIFPWEWFPKYRWKKAIEKLGWHQTDNPRLKNWRWHDLRHAAASWLVMADVPLSKIAKILGHKQLATTQRYAHLADRSLFEAVERIGRVVKGSESTKE